MASTPKTPAKKKTAITAGKPTRSTTKAVSSNLPKSKAAAAAKPTKINSVATAKTEPGTNMSKKELITRVMAQSDMKKGEARRAVEATLLALHGVLKEGRSVSAAPLGKITITREKDTTNGKLVVARIKLKDPQATPKPDQSGATAAK